MIDRGAILRLSALVLTVNLPSVTPAQTPRKILPPPPAPSKSLPASGRVTRSFDATGVKRVVLRAGEAEQAEINSLPGGRFVTVSGIPEGGAAGYHSPDPNWRETPPASWGMGFKARPFGPTMVVSTENEVLYIHHHYHLGGLMIAVPQGVEVIREGRKLNGDGAPDLSPPASR
jgi:hypothetical protein